MSPKIPSPFDSDIRLSPSPSRESLVRAGASELLLIDWRGASPTEVRQSMARTREMLEKREGRKVLMLVDVSGTRWDARLPFETPAWVATIAPSVGRLAITGASGLQLTILSGLRTLTRQPLLAFDTVEQAREWLLRPRGATTGSSAGKFDLPPRKFPENTAGQEPARPKPRL